MIFKFYSPSPLSITMLRRGELFFATGDELNDANELHADFVFNGHKKAWCRLIQLICSWSIEESQRNRILCSETNSIKQLAINIAENAYMKFRRRDARITELGVFLSDLLLHTKDSSDLVKEILKGLSDTINIRIPAQLRQVTAIASFTKSATNPVIWGHYALAGKGFGVIYAEKDNSIRVKTLCDSNITAVLFDLKRKKPIIKNSRTFDIKLESAIYRKSPPKLNGFHILSYPLAVEPENDDIDDDTLYFRGISTKDFKKSRHIKYSAWRYENEVRGLLPFTAFRAGESATRIVEVVPDNIIGIILGPNISEKDKYSCLRALEMLRNYSPKRTGFKSRLLAILKAERQPNSLKLHITPFAGLTPQMQMKKYCSKSEQLKPKHQKYLDELCLKINSQK